MLIDIPERLTLAIHALLDGRTEDARAQGSSALEDHPEEPDVLRILALAEAKAQNYSRATGLLAAAIAFAPDRWSWRIDLGTVYMAAEAWKLAAEQYIIVLEHDSCNVRALDGHGRALIGLGQTARARSCFERLAVLQPDSAEPLLRMARCDIEEGNFTEAVEVLRGALTNRPNHAEILVLLANIYSRCGEDSLARGAWERVIEVSPNTIAARAELVYSCWKLGDLEATVEHCRAIINAGQATLELYSFFVYTLLYDRRESPESIKKACEGFGRFVCRSAPEQFSARPADVKRRKLRIGYLSGEFMGGAAYYFLSPLIGNHNHEAFEIFCYHTRPAVDDQTRWYEAQSQWRDCSGWDDNRIRGRIRADEIDILVDLSGVFPDHRLGIFAGRAAPVQATFPNCPTTTGIAAIDYIFTDRWTCPEGSEVHYSERAARLPSGYLVYAPPQETPALSSPPFKQNGVITFGVFQRRCKMNNGVWDAIAEILRKVQDACLLIQCGDPTLDEIDSFARRDLVRRFREREIGESRLSFIGARSHLDTMSAMARADIALDTFPFQGQTTTCECLWMGVPVVALAGQAHVARVGSAILQRARLAELTAETPKQYVDIAVGLALDRERLSVMRSHLREWLRASPVMDARRLARDVEAAYRWMWSNWCTAHDAPAGWHEDEGDGNAGLR